MTRRRFLEVAGAGAAAVSLTGCLSVSPFAARGRRRVSPNEKLNIACIGVGGQGGCDVEGVSSENIVALCDVDDNQAAETFKKFPQARKFRDFRVMFDEMAREIDAVTVTTPDHMHYPIAIAAIELGKHVFVQKPLTHTIWEARQLAKAARRFKVVTQMGIQGHAMEGPRLVQEWMAAGAIGPVREVHLWTDRPIWPQGIERPTETPPVPSTLDWNLWLGVAPQRPYHPAYAPFNWRGWWDFGCGALGDMACHIMDASFWSLKLGSPTSVEAVTAPVNKETAPQWSILTYEFPARGDLPPVTLRWFDGGKMPPRPADLEPDRELRKEDGGQLIIGEKATIMADTYGQSPRLIPEEKMRALKRPEKTIPRSPGHYQEWIDACKGGPKPGANFDYAGPFTEVVLLGNLAIRTGQRIEWDGERMRCTNVPAANEYVCSAYRKY